jgi:hypothetical protein
VIERFEQFQRLFREAAQAKLLASCSVAAGRTNLFTLAGLMSILTAVSRRVQAYRARTFHKLLFREQSFPQARGPFLATRIRGQNGGVCETRPIEVPWSRARTLPSRGFTPAASSLPLFTATSILGRLPEAHHPGMKQPRARSAACNWMAVSDLPVGIAQSECV